MLVPRSSWGLQTVGVGGCPWQKDLVLPSLTGPGGTQQLVGQEEQRGLDIQNVCGGGDFLKLSFTLLPSLVPEWATACSMPL